MLANFTQSLRDAGNSLAQDPAALQLASQSAGQMLDDALASLRSGEIQVDESYKLLAWRIGATRAAEGIHPRESMQAASIWFQAVVAAMLGYLSEHPQPVNTYALVTLGLERSIAMRIRESAASYTGYLLSTMNEVQVRERRRIARELHDRIGHGLSVTHRQLELYTAHRDTEPAKASVNLETALQSVVETMQSLRAVTSGLHLQEPMQSLEKALLCYLDTIETDGVSVRLRVNGNEDWAVASILDEAYLIIREATRNALAHAEPKQVLIRVDIAPYEMLATIEDDGCGFVPGQHVAQSSVGLASMRERAELMGGTLTVTSSLDSGTLVKLFVPF
jgi:signal transduction histidine kinase